MKNLIILAIALFTINVSATENPVKPDGALRSEIIQLLGDECPVDFDEKECSVEILFTVNSKGEIIVLNANSNNESAVYYIKEKLNYKKVGITVKKEGELFLLPLKIQKS